MSQKKTSNLYNEITSQFVSALKNGAPPWIKPWSEYSPRPTRPKNAITDRKYTGINVTILWTAATTHGFKRDRWLTFNQTRKAGGRVCRGQKGTVVILYRNIEVRRKDESGSLVLDSNGETIKDKIKFIKGFTLFNVDQCDGLTKEIVEGPSLPPEKPAWKSHNEIESLLVSKGVRIRHDCNQAAYYPNEDVIRMPVKKAFKTDSCYYSTLLHELVHWTGHHSRLNRPGICKPLDYSKSNYAFEELIAEIGSAFLCAEFGLKCDLRHESYVISWISELENDPKAIFATSALAWKARSFLLGETEQVLTNNSTNADIHK